MTETAITILWFLLVVKIADYVALGLEWLSREINEWLGR